jgi:hypothetical protein
MLTFIHSFVTGIFFYLN